MREDSDVARAGWVAVIPVKRLAMAKTRLRGAVIGVPHERLVLAMAGDTVAAALACPAVDRALVVTDDPAAARMLTRLGAERVPDDPDPGCGATLDRGLNAALAHGARAAAGSPVVALTGDLPALRPADLAAALAALPVRARRGFVPDAAGTGTAMLAARAGVDLDPRFGPGSARAHAASGAVRLDGSWPTLRQDVDTATDLAAATGLGLGRYTAELLHTARHLSA
jgi:2-phospho-L-lactate/phosphoenolpyruvate guanylyltransferase